MISGSSLPANALSAAYRLNIELMRAQQEDRRRLCYDLHDGIAQTLVPALHYLQTLETTVVGQSDEAAALAAKTRLLLQQALAQVRAVIEDLQLDELGNLSLNDALRLELERHQQDQGWEITFTAEELDLSREQQDLLYRIVREGLTNISKHAAACRVALNIQRVGQSGFAARLQDWGDGFEPDKLTTRRGLGLAAMQIRACQLKARLTITSQIGQGTRLELCSLG